MTTQRIYYVIYNLSIYNSFLLGMAVQNKIIHDHMSIESFESYFYFFRSYNKYNFNVITHACIEYHTYAHILYQYISFEGLTIYRSKMGYHFIFHATPSCSFSFC